MHPMYILSMGETKRFPNKLFAIIVFEKDEKKFYSLSISEEEIQRDKEIWDIGSLVLVEGIEKVYDKRNPIYKRWEGSNCRESFQNRSSRSFCLQKGSDIMISLRMME